MTATASHIACPARDMTASHRVRELIELASRFSAKRPDPRLVRRIARIGDDRRTHSRRASGTSSH